MLVSRVYPVVVVPVGEGTSTSLKDYFRNYEICDAIKFEIERFSFCSCTRLGKIDVETNWSYSRVFDVAGYRITEIGTQVHGKVQTIQP